MKIYRSESDLGKCQTYAATALTLSKSSLAT